MMSSIKNIVFVILATSSFVNAFVTPTSKNSIIKSTKLYESFGFGFAEDTYENQPDLLKGEGEYKAWMNQIKEDNFLNEQYNIIERVRELNLLQKTIDNELLTSLDKQGLDLKTVEGLLPLAEKLGLLSLVANNQQILVNGVAPLAVEGAPFILPVLGKALKIGPTAFYGASLAVVALETLLVTQNVQIPFVGLSAGLFLGLLLVPLAGVLAIAGTAIGSLNK